MSFLDPRDEPQDRHDTEERDLHSFQKADRLRDHAPASDVDPLDEFRKHLARAHEHLAEAARLVNGLEDEAA